MAFSNKSDGLDIIHAADINALQNAVTAVTPQTAGGVIVGTTAGPPGEVPSDHINLMHPDFGVVGDGSDETTKIQAAYDRAHAKQMAVYWPSPPNTYGVSSINLYAGVASIGERSGAATGGVSITGTAGSDVFVLPGGTTWQSGISLRGFSITGGRYQLAKYVSAAGANFVNLASMEFISPTTSGIYVEGSIEEWTLAQVRMSGGQYGFRFAHVPRPDGNNVMDKCRFVDCWTGGQSINAWRIEALTGNTCTWVNPMVNTSGQHGIYLDGGLRSYTFVNLNTESNGTSGKNARTTGILAAGSTALTVASATGLSVGDPLTVAGAGPNQTDLTTTISALAGTAVTLANAATVAATNTPVTNASWDDVFLGSTIAVPSGFNFLGGEIGNEGSAGHLRYALNNAPSGTVYTVGLTSADTIPIYDPASRVQTIGGKFPLRTPANPLYVSPVGISLPTGNPGVEMQRGVVASPPGKPLQMFLDDTNLNGSGTRGNFEIHLLDGNRTLVFSVDGTTKDVSTVRPDANFIAAGALKHTGSTAGFFNSTPVAKRSLAAAATDATSTQALANSLRQALIDLGLGS